MPRAPAPPSPGCARRRAAAATASRERRRARARVAGGAAYPLRAYARGARIRARRRSTSKPRRLGGCNEERRELARLVAGVLAGEGAVEIEREHALVRHREPPRPASAARSELRGTEHQHLTGGDAAVHHARDVLERQSLDEPQMNDELMLGRERAQRLGQREPRVDVVDDRRRRVLGVTHGARARAPLQLVGGHVRCDAVEPRAHRPAAPLQPGNAAPGLREDLGGKIERVVP